MAALGALGLLAVLVALAAVFDLGPFGRWGGTSLTKAEFTAKGDEVCERAHDQFAELQKNPPNSAEGAVALTQNLIEISENELSQIRALDAPPEVQAALDRYLRAREQGIALLEQGLEAAEDEDARAYAAPRPKIAAGQVRRLKLAQAVGFSRVQRGAERHRRRVGQLANARRRSRLRRRRPPRSRWASHPKPIVIARLPAPASHIPARAPGREKAGERDQSASVASSVPRSQARAHQSWGSPRRSATA